MIVSIALLIAMVVMYAIGFALMLDRGLTRILLGFLLVGNATNLLLFLASGSFGAAPLAGNDVAPEEMSDPLPQAFILTAIVITFAVSAFMLALIYRSFRHTDAQDDNVSDDAEDILLAQAEGLTATQEEVTDADFYAEVSDFDSDGDGVDDRVAARRAAQAEQGGQH